MKILAQVWATSLALACSAPTDHRPAPGALGPYSGAVAAGELVFVAGKIGARGDTFAREVGTAIEERLLSL